MRAPNRQGPPQRSMRGAPAWRRPNQVGSIPVRAAAFHDPGAHPRTAPFGLDLPPVADERLVPLFLGLPPRPGSCGPWVSDIWRRRVCSPCPASRSRLPISQSGVSGPILMRSCAQVARAGSADWARVPYVRLLPGTDVPMSVGRNGQPRCRRQARSQRPMIFFRSLIASTLQVARSRGLEPAVCWLLHQQ